MKVGNNKGRVRLLKSVSDLDHHLHLWQNDRKPGLVLLTEGADPIVHVDDLPKWWQRGLRNIGLTYGRHDLWNRRLERQFPFRQGGLTMEGKALLESMAELGFIWDISHLTEEGVFRSGWGFGPGRESGRNWDRG